MKYFYKDISIDVGDSVYYPREDSELLAKVIEGMDIKGKKVLEIGCGSGLLSIIMAKKGADVTAADINEDAVETTRINAEKNRANVAVFVSDMFDKVNDKFDLIIFNPPYLPVGEDYVHDISDIAYAGGSTGREIIEVFLNDAPGYMKSSGRLLFVISSLTDEAEVLSLVREAGLRPRVVAREKIPWEELIAVEAAR